MILTAYFDESGTHAGSPATVMSGVMGNAKQWGRFQVELDKIKKRYGFTVFHAKEFKARSGEFSRWPNEKYSALLYEMMVASSRLMEAVTFTLPNEVYDQCYQAGEKPRRLRLDSKYGLCFRYSLLNFVVESLRRLRTHKHFRDTRMHVVMESGHKNAGDAERIFHEMQNELRANGLDLLDTISFAPKDRCDPIMIADYLAHGGLMMHLAGADKNRKDDPPGDKKVTGMSSIVMTPQALSELKAELVDQMRSTGKARFILPVGQQKASGEGGNVTGMQ